MVILLRNRQRHVIFVYTLFMNELKLTYKLARTCWRLRLTIYCQKEIQIVYNSLNNVEIQEDNMQNQQAYDYRICSVDLV